MFFITSQCSAYLVNTRGLVIYYLFGACFHITCQFFLKILLSLILNHVRRDKTETLYKSCLPDYLFEGRNSNTSCDNVDRMFAFGNNIVKFGVKNILTMSERVLYLQKDLTCGATCTKLLVYIYNS